jgi:hypothetical protein
MKKIVLLLVLFWVAHPSFSQNKEIEAVKSVLKNAVEKLDVSGTENLFTTDSQIFESGGSEGN